MKKTFYFFILVIFFAVDSNAQAAFYQCRSMMNGFTVIANLSEETLIIKDRLGNELDIKDNIQIQSYDRELEASILKIYEFYEQDKLIFKVNDRPGRISAETDEDFSFQCRYFPNT